MQVAEVGREESGQCLKYPSKLRCHLNEGVKQMLPARPTNRSLYFTLTPRSGGVALLETTTTLPPGASVTPGRKVAAKSSRLQKWAADAAAASASRIAARQQSHHHQSSRSAPLSYFQVGPPPPRRGKASYSGSGEKRVLCQTPTPNCLIDTCTVLYIHAFMQEYHIAMVASSDLEGWLRLGRFRLGRGGYREGYQKDSLSSRPWKHD